MGGEACREAGILVAVFGLLDPLWHDETKSSIVDPSTPWAWYSSVFVVTLLLWLIGVGLERTRK